MPEPKKPRQTEVEEVYALADEALAIIRKAPRTHEFWTHLETTVRFYVGRAYELGGARRSYFERRAAEEHELLEAERRRHRVDAAELRYYRSMTPLSFRPPREDEPTQEIEIEQEPE